MSKSFIDEVRELNKLAVERTAKTIVKIEEENKLRDELDRQIAERMLESVKRRVKKAARKGERIIYELYKINIYKDGADGKCKYLNLVERSRPDVLCEINLKRKYKYLYKLCKEIGLTPTVTYAHDGCGVEDWYSFNVAW
jgi:hypothetical protein